MNHTTPEPRIWNDSESLITRDDHPKNLEEAELFLARAVDLKYQKKYRALIHKFNRKYATNKYVAMLEMENCNEDGEEA